ncbi:hypothetical protein KAM479c_31170 (plasmid) [Aeromonas caviae]|nr:hypothetical protein KAM479c_31170 [Aeromonas caviae]
MVEGEGAEGGRDPRIPLDDHHLVTAEGLIEQGAQHGVGVRGELGELDHGAVAGSEGADEGPEAQHHREIPGHHDADHAEGLIVHLDPGGCQQQAGMTALRFHPPLEPFQGVVDLHDAGEHIGDQAVVIAALAVVPGQGLTQCLLVAQQPLLEGVKSGAAGRQIRHGGGLAGLPEPMQLLGEGELVR